jgi:MraZ protein
LPKKGNEEGRLSQIFPQGIMFKGSYKYSIDKKNRVSLPARLRRQLQEKESNLYHFFLGLEGCIYIYTHKAWLELEEKIRKISPFDEKGSYFKRRFLKDAYEDFLDDQYRLSINKSLLEKANIQNEVFILGQVDSIELWDPQTFEEYEKTYSDSYKEIARSVMHGS